MGNEQLDASDDSNKNKDAGLPWPQEQLASLFFHRNERKRSKEALRRSGPWLRIGSLRKKDQRHLGTRKPYDLFGTQRSSNSPPRAEFERRTNSLNDVREDRPIRLSTETAREVANPHLPSYEHRTKHEQVEPSFLCNRCKGATIQRLTAEGGYKHSTLGEILLSKLDCKLCRLILLEISKIESWTPDRYRIVLSLHSDNIVHKPDHDDHGRDDYIYPLDFIYATVWDDRPWQIPEYHKNLGTYRKEYKRYADITEMPPFACRSRPLQCFTEENDPAVAFGLRWIRPIGTNTASQSSFEIASGWLRKCIAEGHAEPKDYWHKKLNEDGNAPRASPMSAERPSRLVEIGSSPHDNDVLRLIETNNQDFRYAALSYCWGDRKPGDSQSFRTTTSSVHQRLKGFSRDALPATLRDSILIAQNLGIPYIWIDALCIVQDSSDDWNREAAKMAGIYLGCELAIAVSASTAVDQGCFNQQSQTIIREEEFGHNWAVVDSTLQDGRTSRLYFGRYLHGYHSWMFREETLRGALSKRAWTYQEHVLPRRTLYYTSRQLFWECTHCRLREDNYPQVQSERPCAIADYKFMLDSERTVLVWYSQVVEEYSRRQLSFQRDKLVALSALAKATAMNKQKSYIAGIWSDCLISGLVWRRCDVGRKSRTYTCPSWSWASQDSPVSYDRTSAGSDTDSPFLPRVLDVQWEPTNRDNPYADVLSAHIDMDIWIGLGTVLRDDFRSQSGMHRHGDEYEHSQALFVFEPGSYSHWEGDAWMDDSGTGVRQVTLALLLVPMKYSASSTYLLLEPPDLEAKEYRRVGLAQIWNSGGSFGTGRSVLSRYVRRKIRLV